jgi:hypothetical protein
MPTIDWTSLPKPIWRHLMQRARERKISADDLIQLDQWKQSNPQVPDGHWVWVKDFGNFKLVGEGRYPKTFLLRGQAARGQRID